MPHAAIVTEIESIGSSASQNDPAFESKYKFEPAPKLNQSNNESNDQTFYENDPYFT